MSMNIKKANEKIIRNFKPEEMESYMKILIAKLYGYFLNQDAENALKCKSNIEEATNIYLSEGYDNTLSKELEFRLSEANKRLVEVLAEKSNLEYSIAELIYIQLYERISFLNRIMETLITLQEKEPSEETTILINGVFDEIGTEINKIGELLTDTLEEDTPEEAIVDELLELDLIKNEFETMDILSKKIKSYC